jgi:hypothetical protein
MRIFVGYGYNDRDTWVKELAFPLIMAVHCEPVDGKEIYGQRLDDGVRNEIRGCAGLLGFSTRRERLQNGNWTTHQWVKDELLTADQVGLRFVEIREAGVDPQEGMLGNVARISYDEARRDRCLVEIAIVLKQWTDRHEKPYEIYLMPEAFTQAVARRLKDPELRCIYRVWENDKAAPEDEIETKIWPFKGGLAIRTAPIRRDALIQVEVWNGRAELLWTSVWQPVDSRTITLSKEV